MKDNSFDFIVCDGYGIDGVRDGDIVYGDGGIAKNGAGVDGIGGHAAVHPGTEGLDGLKAHQNGAGGGCGIGG